MKKLNIFTLENQDGRFILLHNDAIAQTLERGNRWEPHFVELVSKLINKNDIVMDCGANFEYNTIVMANILQNTGKIYSFEPQRLIYQQLNANVIYNGFTNIYTYNVAIGEKSDEIQMETVDYHSDWINIGATSVGRGGDTVMMVGLDELDIEPISFMKIDVQGCELQLLKGANTLIRNSMPIIFIEIEEPYLNKFGTSSNEIIQYIKNLDYKIYLIRSDYPVDHICIPNGKNINISEFRQSYNYELEEV